MYAAFQINNYRQVNSDIRRMQTAFGRLPSKMARKYVRKAVTEATKDIRSRLRQYVPKRTGRMRKGIAYKFTYDHYGRKFFQYRIGFNKAKAPHAWFLEDGTKVRHTKKGANRGRVPKTAFFTVFMRANGPAVGAKIAAALKKYLEAAMKEGMP